MTEMKLINVPLNPNSINVDFYLCRALNAVIQCRSL